MRGSSTVADCKLAHLVGTPVRSPLLTKHHITEPRSPNSSRLHTPARSTRHVTNSPRNRARETSSRVNRLSTFAHGYRSDTGYGCDVVAPQCMILINLTLQRILIQFEQVNQLQSTRFKINIL